MLAQKISWLQPRRWSERTFVYGKGCKSFRNCRVWQRRKSDESCVDENSKIVGNIGLTNDSATWSVVMSRIVRNYSAQTDESPTVTTRADFKSVWPISSNRAPRRRGPRATPTNQQKFVLCIEADCEYFRAGVQCFPRGCERPKRFLNYSNGLSKQFKLALLPPSKYTKTILTIISVFR